MRAIYTAMAGTTLLLSAGVYADPVSVEPSLISAVAESESWKKQLYLSTRKRDGGYLPRINEPAFYFSDTPRIDPEVELRLTLEAVFTDIDQISNDHPGCRFPGRFLFLNQALELGYPASMLENCKAFQDWAQFDRYDTLSVVMVEGYYGNPASSFGHLVLRHGREDNSRQLLDTSINFGARVPQGEGPIRYIAKGLSGGYQASFTVENYYRQDLVYTRVEHRDMWNYPLDLNDAQRRFFLAHVWELLDSPTTYYFLKNNCAFAVAEILEIVFERNLVNQNTLFYPPVTLFHELESIQKSGELSVIGAKHYIPSQKRVLGSLFANLSSEQRQIVMAYSSNFQMNLESHLAELSEQEAAEVVEALISYFDYLIKGYPELGTELYERRRELIITRLSYPSGRFLQPAAITPGTEPGKTSRVSRLRLGGRLEADKQSALLGWIPYSRGALDLGNDDFSELTLLSVSVIANTDDLDAELGIIRVSKRSDVRERLPGDWPLSWTIDVGATSHSLGYPGYGLQADLQLGQSISTGPLLWSALGSLRQSGLQSGIGARAEVGYAGGRTLSWLAATDFTQWASGHRLQYSLDAQLSFSPDWSLSMGLSHQIREGESDRTAGSLLLNWHFR